MRMVLVIAILGATFAALLTLAEVTLAYGRPPQPLPLGTVQWFYEVGATVDRVDRVREIGAGSHALRAKGEFYVVHARVLAPFGLRPEWNDNDVEVRTFAGTGATMPAMRFGVDERAQSLLDRQTGRPGSVHLVRGAEQQETLVFDLPRNVEQPGLMFLPANEPFGLLAIIGGHFWAPHRFNLRYD